MAPQSPDWRSDLLQTLGVRIPIACLFAGTLWGVFLWGMAYMEDTANQEAALTAIVAQCVGE
jgi:hypothetical protein